MADIKTRDTVKGTIKTLDKAAIAGQKMKQAYIATKDKAEHSVNTNENTAEEYAADKTEAGIDEKTVNKFIARRDFNYPAWLKDFCLNNGVTILTSEDGAYPYSLKQIASPPQVLYVKGSLPDLRGSIGIVGSREASGYGLKAADAFAADLAAAGVVIVSGGARGIDTAAHRGALAAGGITVAVLGCGIDIAYPAANKNLFAQICERGALVTEYHPGTPPAAYNFPARNRIINGMTHGILVAEAAKKSGAMITAEYALEEGHEVYCVPGSIFLPTSIGCHSLIKSGAQLVDRPEDILESLKLASFPQQPALFASGNGEDELDDNAKAVLKILSFEPLSLEEILEKSGLGLAEAGMGLLDLEMRGKVAQTAARSCFRRTFNG